MDGIIPLDKPPGLTSARAVDLVKSFLPRGTKIGHAGTLDPFATGALVLLVGKATKLCETLMDAPKQYVARARLGATTATDDLESPEQPKEIVAVPTLGEVDRALQRFVGEIEQIPPQFSAMKVEGRRAYEIARKGGPVDLQPRKVKVYAIRRTGYAWPYLSFEVDCGRGTYIRSIARDVGEALGVGGYLKGLRRTRVGRFGRDYSLVRFEDLARFGVDDEHVLLPMSCAE
jgi:tRNA pseudouridine55 synthase